MTTDDWKRKAAVERMDSDLRYRDEYKKRGRALDNLGALLGCESPGTVSEVSVRQGRWWRRNPSRRPEQPREEIVLSDHERREFARWCAEQARDYERRAREIEVKYAMGAADDHR